MRDDPRRALAAAAVALALVACGRGSSSPRPLDDARATAPLSAADAAAAPIAPGTTVRSVTGVAERRVGDAWVALQIGDQLGINDQIRTAEGAATELDLGGETLVTIGATSELTIREVSESVSNVMLGSGRVSAQVPAGSSKIRLETRGGSAVVEADDGEFSAIASGSGDVTVATTKGTARLTSSGATVAIARGRQATARAGEAPSVPVPIPASLFLKVKPLGGDLRETVVRGETAPGAVVSINGVRMTTDADGTFDTRLAALEGDNVIVVFVEDASGRSEQKVLRRTVNRRPPPVKAEVTW